MHKETCPSCGSTALMVDPFQERLQCCDCQMVWSAPKAIAFAEPFAKKRDTDTTELLLLDEHLTMRYRYCNEWRVVKGGKIQLFRDAINPSGNPVRMASLPGEKTPQMVVVRELKLSQLK